MLGIWKSKKPDVLKYEHWTFEQFEYSPSEYYDAIETELAARELPGLTIERIMHNEGGMFSAQREYLRMRRERLVFDICFAQFGAYWFCSRRYSEIPAALRVWELVVVLAVFAGVEWFFANMFGMILGSSLFGASLLGIGLLMHNLVSMGLHDLDAALIQVPVIGGIYEFFFRKETYYREDTRSAYVSIVDAITKEKLDALTNAHDAKLVAYLDATPPSHPTVMRLIGDLLRLRQ